MAPPLPQLGNYQLLKKLATGGMAEVWLAKQVGIEGFNRHVVVKRILPHLAEDPEFVQMFLNEAKIAAKFSHPNIVQIFDFGEKDHTYFIAMEFIHGEDLGRLMRKAWSTSQWIARPLAIRIVASACEGLYYAHTRKDEEGRPLRVVHRDISPQNILISFDGTVKLVDFGIAKAADQVSMTKSGAIKGKFAYMAPEQAAGKPLDARTDLFAIGLVLYELLTGVRPLKRDSELATLQAALECKIEAPSVVAEVPPELDDVVMRALAKAPDDRYKDTRQFQMSLEEFLIGQRMVATSVQISELMETLFVERLSEESKLGAPNPSSQESMSASPAVPEPPGWEAPKGSRASIAAHRPPRQREPPTQQQPQHEDPGTDSAPPGEAGGPEYPSWEAPPGTVVPSRRYTGMQGQGSNQSTSVARPSQEINVTRARPATREVQQDDPRPPRSSQPRRSNVQVDPNLTSDELPEVDDDDEATMGEPPPRKSSPAIARVRKSNPTGTMPEAPTRKSRASVPAVSGQGRRTSGGARRVSTPVPDSEADLPQVKSKSARDAALDDYVGLELKKAKQRETRNRVLTVAVVLGLGTLGFFFKDQIMGAVQKSGRTPVLLSVTTDPSVRVMVYPADKGEPRDLGMSPFERVSGVYVNDTVVLSDPTRGIDVRKVINFGNPGEIKVIEQKFVEVVVTVKTNPSMKGLSVWRGNSKLGNAGIGIRLYEGHHTLEVRGDGLSTGVPFELDVPADKPLLVVPVDIKDAIEKEK